MTEVYSTEIYNDLAKKFDSLELSRPMKIDRFEVGTQLIREIESVETRKRSQIEFKIEKFVGGGFAGQVYQVKVIDINGDAIPEIELNKKYAIKILVPPSHFSLIFRNIIYRIGFQGAFQLQVNPAAARSGAIWQKFIRKASELKFKREDAVVDIFATFIDPIIGSCGEISEWVDGRVWKLEIDQYSEQLSEWQRTGKIQDNLGSPEFRAKYSFMHNFVELLHEIGAPEFARQYEWNTCKSQPNCLKLKKYEDDVEKGLIAVDFRAGLALLPFLPMSPGDFNLIIKGIRRGSLVQFDRGCLKTLKSFIEKNKTHFAGMEEMFAELEEQEQIYRNSLIDITHNRFRLFHSGTLWKTIIESSTQGLEIRNIIDNDCHSYLKNRKIISLIFITIGLIPFIGKTLLRFLGNKDLRTHYLKLFTPKYLLATFKGRACENIIKWYRGSRISKFKAETLINKPLLCFLHLILSFFPVSIHKALTEKLFLKERLVYIFVRPVRLYFSPIMREKWLMDMLESGKKSNLVSDEDAAEIISQLKEPFIQKYLKSLAVHVCTLPVTQVVSIIIAIVFVLMHPEMARAEAWGIGLGIVAIFQVVPISPGSLARGLYVLYLVIRERNFKDYNIAVFLGFFKYIGYLAFPIQMSNKYPVLARFMASHWATGAVHIIPVFGEHGALLEHKVYSFFYNKPLSIKRRMGEVAKEREKQDARIWHMPLTILTASSIFIVVDYLYMGSFAKIADISQVWHISLVLALGTGFLITHFANGMKFSNRIISSAVSGFVIGLISLLFCSAVGDCSSTLLIAVIWRMFFVTIFSTISSVLKEIFI